MPFRFIDGHWRRPYPSPLLPPILTDFGLATATVENESPTGGSPAGTAPYMAPEQAAGAREIGPECDVYALGATMYHLLCGRPPYAPGPNPLPGVSAWQDVVRQVCDGNVTPAPFDGEAAGSQWWRR